MLQHVHHVAYIVDDMDEAVHVFRDTFALELTDRRVISRSRGVEIAIFRCGQALIELLRPIHHPELSAFLTEHGPGLHHVAFGVRNLSNRVEQLRRKGVTVQAPFIAPTGWNIAYFDLNNNGLRLFRSQHHGDHLVESAAE